MKAIEEKTQKKDNEVARKYEKKAKLGKARQMWGMKLEEGNLWELKKKEKKKIEETRKRNEIKIE